MPKPQLAEPQQTIESHLIETMIAGLKEWRSDLSYPASYSDMQACARGVLRMFDVKRAALPNKLKYKEDNEINLNKDDTGKILCQFCKTSSHTIFNDIHLCNAHYEKLTAK